MKNILIYGAGGAGRELLGSTIKKKINVIAFVDSNFEKRNSFVDEVKVIHETDIQKETQKQHIDEIWIAIPSITKIEILKIRSRLLELVDNVKWIPSSN